MGGVAAHSGWGFQRSEFCGCREGRAWEGWFSAGVEGRVVRVAGGAVCDDGNGGGGGDDVTVMSDAVVRVEGCLSDD